MKVTLADVKSVCFCNKGARVWCKAHGIDWDQLVREGVEASSFKDIKDPMLKRVLDASVKRTYGR